MAITALGNWLRRVGEPFPRRLDFAVTIVHHPNRVISELWPRAGREGIIAAQYWIERNGD